MDAATLTTKSKRVNQCLLNGKGMIAHGYWVDFHRHFIVRKISDHLVEWFEFKEGDGHLVSYSVKTRLLYQVSEIKALMDDMRKIAPLPRWYPYTPASSYGTLTAFEEAIAEYKA